MATASFPASSGPAETARGGDRVDFATSGSVGDAHIPGENLGDVVGGNECDAHFEGPGAPVAIGIVGNEAEAGSIPDEQR